MMRLIWKIRARLKGSRLATEQCGASTLETIVIAAIFGIGAVALMMRLYNSTSGANDRVNTRVQSIAPADPGAIGF